MLVASCSCAIDYGGDERCALLETAWISEDHAHTATHDESKIGNVRHQKRTSIERERNDNNPVSSFLFEDISDSIKWSPEFRTKGECIHSPFRTRTMSSSIPLHVHCLGSRSAPNLVLLVHGLLGSVATWHPLLERCFWPRELYHIVAVDLLGMGSRLWRNNVDGSNRVVATTASNALATTLCVTSGTQCGVGERTGRAQVRR